MHVKPFFPEHFSRGFQRLPAAVMRHIDAWGAGPYNWERPFGGAGGEAVHRWLRLLTAVLWGCLLFAAPARAERTNRLLLVGCDRFVTQDETTPASANNVERMAEVLSGGAMAPERLITRRNDLADLEELAALAAEAFAGADEDDVSYFYLSTHGIWDDTQPEGVSLLLSDGEREARITAAWLKALFDPLPGTKVLILDACHSGALIGKGVDRVMPNPFAGGAYKIICSSGGAEESWFWAAADRESSGAGYFSDALAYGMSGDGAFGADSNRDGTVTLTELRRYLLEHQGASTPRTYPEEDSFSVFAYDAEAVTGGYVRPLLTGLTWNTPVLDQAWPRADFSFTMLREAQLAYQLVLLDQDRWQFADATLLWDTAEGLGYGMVSPGTKSRSISLSREDEESGGYALLQILSLTGGVPRVLSSHVLCVPPLTGDPGLSVEAGTVFRPAGGEEASAVIRHSLPCALSVSVTDAAGNIVRRLLTRQPTRPEKLRPTGTFLSWNGRLADGEAAPPGEYRFQATAWVGDEVYRAESPSFLLLPGPGDLRFVPYTRHDAQ